jgi:hypothetical protein
MSGIYSFKVMKKLQTIQHYVQLYRYINMHTIDCNTIDCNTIVKIQQFVNDLDLSDAIILELIEQMSKYKFYIEKTNEYCNNLSLLQFFECIEYNDSTYKYKYKYNIFYDFKSDISNTLQPIDIKYIKCFRKKLERGKNDMDFRLLSLDNFTTWLKILGDDYVCDSRTFSNHKTEYTQEYNKYKKERNSYVYKNNTEIKLCQSLIDYNKIYINKLLQKNKNLEHELLNLRKKYEMLEAQVSILSL